MGRQEGTSKATDESWLWTFDRRTAQLGELLAMLPPVVVCRMGEGRR